MKKFMKCFTRIRDWYRESNRHIHAKLGAAIFFCMLFMCIVMLVLYVHALIISSVTTLLVMIGVEIAQKRDGGVFDCNDVLAGMTAPIAVTALSAVVYLFMMLIA